MAGPILPTSKGTPFFSRLAWAFFCKSWLSAAKPTQNKAPFCALADLATSAKISGFSVNCKSGVSPCAVFLIFCSATCATRQSATAAVATKTDASPTHDKTAPCISAADCTSMRVTPRGVGKCTGPAITVTSAPASCAARAIAKPIFPLDKLVMPRTGSIAS